MKDMSWLRNWQENKRQDMKIIDGRAAAKLIDDGMMVYVGGFGAYSGVDELLKGLAGRYEVEGHPEKLTVISGICSGYSNMEPIGHNLLKAEGLMDTIIAGHFMLSGEVSRMVSENKVAAFALPLGALPGMLGAGASGRPGFFSKVGLGTYVDPEVSGYAVNPRAKEQSEKPLVQHTEFAGEDYLFYSAIKPDVCLVRGTISDEDGNISLRREGLHEYQLQAAMATKNNGGTVIFQVEEIVPVGEINPKEIKVPGMLVDYVVVADKGNHMQYYGADYDPAVSAEAKVPAEEIEPMALDVRKVIARRAAMELRDGAVVNLGIGLPAGVGSVAIEEGLAPNMTLSLETGPIGGVPLSGPAFAGAINHDVLMDAEDAFAFYDGGGLDMAFLGAAEVDAKGNVNVSMFGVRCAGPGGFINISQNTPKVCFMGTFTAGKSEIEIRDGKVCIDKDGDGIKFLRDVQQITFSGDYGAKTGQEVLYITERAVFRLIEAADQEAGGVALELIEIAPGADLKKDVLDKMEFKPVISPDLKEMEQWIFR